MDTNAVSNVGAVAPAEHAENSVTLEPTDQVSLGEVGAMWAGAFFFYFLTAGRGIGFGDTAILVNAIEQGIIVSHVNNHPLTVALGWVFSCIIPGEPAFSANMVSVVFGSLTAALLFWLLRVYGASLAIAGLATAPVVVSHALWWHSTLIENYAVTAALVLATYHLLFRFELTKNAFFLQGACACAAFSITNHVQNGFLCLGVAACGVYAARYEERPIKSIFTCGLAALAGLTPWICLVLRDSFAGPGLRQTLSDAFVGKFEGIFFNASVRSMVWDTAYIVWNQSPILLLPIGAAIGVWAYLRRFGVSPTFLGMAVHTGLTFLVFSGYPTWDRFAFLLAALIPLSFFAGVGMNGVAKMLGDRRGVRVVAAWSIGTLLLCPMLYSSVTVLARDPNSMWARRYGNGHSYNLYDQAAYIANPNRAGYYDVESFAELLKEKLPPNALFLDDDSRTYYPLAEYYQRYLGLRRDVRFLLVNSWGFSDWGIDASSLEKVVENAYYSGKPFFVPSLGSPFGSFFAGAKKRFPVNFVQFPLSSTRWIYKLQTAEDARAERLEYGRRTREAGRLNAVVVNGASGVINVTTKNVLYTVGDSLILQNMAAYGAQWLRDDQVFLKSEVSGAELELFLTSDTDTPVPLTLVLTTGPDFGEVEAYVDGEKVGAATLFSTVVDTTKLQIPARVINRGGSIVTLRVVGKAVASTGYCLGIDAVTYQR